MTNVDDYPFYHQVRPANVNCDLAGLMAIMHHARRRGFGRVNAKGRSTNTRFVKLELWMFKKEAWTYLANYSIQNQIAGEYRQT